MLIAAQLENNSVKRNAVVCSHLQPLKNLASQLFHTSEMCTRAISECF